MQRPASESHPLANPAVVVLLIVAVAVFAWRSFARSPRLYDFRTVYAAARAWGAGANPYDHPTLERIWKDAGGQDLVGGGAIENFPSVYPPTTFAVVWPIALLPARAACTAWLAIMLALLLAMLYELGTLADLPFPRRILLAAIVLLLGPLHSGVQGGNVVVPAVALIVIGLAQLHRARRAIVGRAHPTVVAGMAMLVIATCLKPQLGLPILAWQLLRFPRAAAVALSICCIALLATVGRMHMANVPWLPSLRANYAVAAGPGGSFDFTLHNRYRDHLTNAQVPVFSIVREATATQAIVAVITAGLIAAFLLRRWQLHRERGGIDDLLALSVVAAIALVPVYHRYYDATLLCLPIAYAVRAGARNGKILLLLTLTLLLPLAWASNLAQKGFVSPAVQGGWVWNVLVMPFNGWMMLLWSGVLVWTWCRSDSATAS